MTGISSYRRIAEEHLEQRMLRYYRECLQKAGMENCRLYVSEWNISLSNRNYLNDSCFRSAYFVEMIQEICDLTDMICLWFASDWISNYYDARCIANGAGGILTKDNIKKPIWYAILFLNYLGEEVVQMGEHYIVTRCSDGSYMIVCSNFKPLGLNYFMMGENEVSLDYIQELFENSSSLGLSICFENLSDQEEYIVRKQQINSECGSVLMEWKKMGMSDDLERSDVKYITEKCVPNLERYKIKAEHGEIKIRCEMRDQEIVLYHVYKEEN